MRNTAVYSIDSLLSRLYGLIENDELLQSVLVSFRRFFGTPQDPHSVVAESERRPGKRQRAKKAEAY
jgi:hypothetical protein